MEKILISMKKLKFRRRLFVRNAGLFVGLSGATREYYIAGFVIFAIRISFPCIMNLCLFLCIVGSAGMGTAGTPPLTDGNTIWQGRFLSNIKSFPILSRG